MVGDALWQRKPKGTKENKGCVVVVVVVVASSTHR